MKVSKSALLTVVLCAVGSVQTSENRRKPSVRKNTRAISSREASIKEFVGKVCLKYADEAICRKGFGKDRKGNLIITSCRELDDIANKIAEKYPDDLAVTVPALRNEINRHWYSGSHRDVRAMQNYAEKQLRQYSDWERIR